MKRRKNQQPAIQLKNVSFQYPSAEKPSIQHVDLSVEAGELVVLTGGSGCGKTTITRVVNGLGEQFYEGHLTGEVIILGKPVSEYPLCQMGKVVGSIFQDPRSQFFASITEDEIAFGCENYGVAFEELESRVSAALRGINGEMLCGREIHPMSSGEKQKIAVASVNAVNPQIYVFDEPSANLDMYSVEALKALMKRLKEEGHTLLVAEHRLYYLTELADRVLYMDRGEIQKEWRTEEILALSEEERKGIGIRAADLGRIAMEPPEQSERAETLAVEHLTFSYHKHPVFQNISFRAHAGDILAVVGRNGVGKTTLSNILCGIQKENSGTIRYGGKEILVKKRRKTAYFVMQNTECQLFGDSVLEELKLNGLHTDPHEIEELLKRYDLYEQKDAHPATLSGGQKQRLTIAVSNWIDTPVLILDEPTSGLDFRNMQRISRRLKSLAHRDKTILVITHDLEFAAMTCNKVLLLGGGEDLEIYSLQNNLARLHQDLMCHGMSV